MLGQAAPEENSNRSKETTSRGMRQISLRRVVNTVHQEIPEGMEKERARRKLKGQGKVSR